MKRLLIIFLLPASLLWFGPRAFAEDGNKDKQMAPHTSQPAGPVVQNVPKPDAPPSPIAAPTEWYLRFDQANLNVLSACIQELPKRVADPFLATIQAQIGKQAEIVAAIKAK